MTTKRWLLSALCAVLLAVLGFAVVAGAVASHTDEARRPDWIISEWTKLMHSYNINPVYPPSEDIHVGDVYGINTDVDPTTKTAKDGGLFSSTKVAYVSMTKELDDYYGAIPVMPETAPVPSESDAIWRQLPSGSTCDGKQCKIPDGDGVSVFQTAGKMRSLSIVAFPGFSISRSIASDVNAGFLPRAWQAAFGGHASGEDAISVKIRGAETYGVPAMVALRELRRLCTFGTIAALQCYHSNVSVALSSLNGKSADHTALSMVYRVYLTRSIEYTFSATSVIGAQAAIVARMQKAALENEQDKGERKSNPDATHGASNALTPSDRKVQELRDAQAALTQAVSDQALKSATPGTTLSIGSNSENGVSIIEKFERPVAIGYRSVSIATIHK